MLAIKEFAWRVRRPSVLSLMLLVAFVAVSIVAARKGVAWKRVRDGHLASARSHSNTLQVLLQLKRRTKGPTLRAFDEWEVEVERHHRDLEQKYLRGAARPWQPMPPDPPSPRPPTSKALRESIDEMLEREHPGRPSLKDLERAVKELRERGIPKRMPWKDERPVKLKSPEFI